MNPISLTFPSAQKYLAGELQLKSMKGCFVKSDIVKATRYKINIWRRYFNWSKANCIFVHVPKAAGTSVNKAIYGRTLGHYSACEIQEKFPKLYERVFTFSLVRNPW